MEWITKESTVALLSYLLPGFFAAWVFYGLTAHPKRDVFERTVQALIFVALIQMVVVPIHSFFQWWGNHVFNLGDWTITTNLFWSLLAAAVLGILISYLANNDLPHEWFRKRKITSKTSFPSEWYSAFTRDKRFMVLHLKDGRRLHAWSFEWPDQPDSGHFVLMEPSWLLSDGTAAKLHHVERMLLPVSDVGMIEMLKSGDEITASADEMAASTAVLLKSHQTTTTLETIGGNSHG